MNSRAYSLIDVKNFDDNRRIFSGWATTPALDRVQDSIDPMGAKFKNPLVLLHQHQHDQPIGTVKFKKPTPEGIEFEAEIPLISEPGPLKDRVDTAWGEVKSGIVRAVSVGFRSIKHSIRDDGGFNFEEIEIFELSTVSIPANATALITAVKSIDNEYLRQIAGEQNSSDDAPAAPGKTRVVKLNANPSRVREPFQLNHVKITR